MATAASHNQFTPRKTGEHDRFAFRPDGRLEWSTSARPDLTLLLPSHRAKIKMLFCLSARPSLLISRTLPLRGRRPFPLPPRWPGIAHRRTIPFVSPQWPRTFLASLPRMISPLLPRPVRASWQVPIVLLGRPSLFPPALKTRNLTRIDPPLSSCLPLSLPPCQSLPARESCANPPLVSTTSPLLPPRTSKRCPTSRPNRLPCVAHLLPPSIFPSSPTPATQILFLPVATTGHPLIPPRVTVPLLPKVSGMATACPLRTLLSWVVLKETLLLPPPALLTSTGTASPETWPRNPRPICPG